jgi:glutaredoxin
MTIDALHYYWRPGCPFCSMLRRGLDKAGIQTVDHNIWDDPGEAAVVRRYAKGNETVPTVVVGDVGLVNPSVKQLIAHLAEHAPHLLPEGLEAGVGQAKPGLIGRLLGG